MLKKILVGRFFSGNDLKVIASILMLVDHIGCILFPQYPILRIIGRLSFPIFSYMIAEGCYYTRNKSRYFFGIFSLAVVCQIAYYIFENSLYMGILITFSLSIIMIYSLEYFKEKLFLPDSSLRQKITSFIIFLCVVAMVYILNIHINIDYGFWGCMTPVFASVFKITKKTTSGYLQKFDCQAVHILMMAIGLLLVSIDLGGYQFYSLFALVFILTYSGQRGKFNMKIFFYVFYPLHLIVLHIISILIK